MLSVDAILRGCLRGGSVVKSTVSVTLQEDLSPIISTHVRQLIAACNSGPIAVPTLLAPRAPCTHIHIPPHTHIHIKIRTYLLKMAETSVNLLLISFL